MALDPRIEVVREQYGLSKDDFWQLQQNKATWLVKHAALEIVAAKAGIRFDMPVVLEAAGGAGIAALCVRGELEDRWEWATGEASPKNSKNSYPWAMAEKRAKDRVILKLVGIHGLVYSEDEIGGVDEPDVLPKAKAREPYAAMREEIAACMTLDDLARLWRSPAFQAEFQRLPQDWKDLLTQDKDALKAALSPASPVNGYVDPRKQFDEMERPQ